MKKQKILFLSRIVPESLIAEVENDSFASMQNAAISFQQKIINGIEKNICNSVSLFNLLPIDSYPKYYKKPFIKSFYFSHVVDSQDLNVGFCNIQYLKRLSLKRTFLSQLKTYVKRKSFDTVICYSANLVLLSATKYLKRHFPNIKTCLIISDMPEFNDLSEKKGLLTKLYLRYSGKKTRSFIDYLDCFVFPTQLSADYFCNKKPFAVVEGICESRIDNNDLISKTKCKRVVYTGSTNKQFGIINLLDAFEMMKYDDAELVICGCGDSDDVIKMRSNKNNRIVFLGIVSRDKAVKLQREASVLVNPRQNVGEYTKYSFPSKTMEYLSSGVPLVAYKLDGIPNEYDDYIFYVEDNAISSLARKLEEVLSMTETERKTFGRKAQHFIMTSKNSISQTRKIIDMLDNISEGV